MGYREHRHQHSLGDNGESGRGAEAWAAGESRDFGKAVTQIVTATVADSLVLRGLAT